MDLSESFAESWLDIAQMDVQQESSRHSWQNGPIQTTKVIKDPICLFRQFVSAVSSDTLKDVRPQSEFSFLVRDLCVNTPSVAQYLVQEILNHSTEDSQTKVQGSQEFETSTTPKQSSKRRKQSDCSYRLPKSSRTQPHIPRNGAKDSNEASNVNSQVGDDTATCQSGHGNMTVIQSTNSLVTEKPFQERERDIPKIIAEEVPQEGTVPQQGIQGQSFADGHTLPSMGSESAVHQSKSTYSSDNAKMNAVHRRLSVALDKAIGDGQTTIRTPSPSAEQRETALSEIDGKGSDAQASSEIPSTPAGKISSGLRSPISDNQTTTPQTVVFTPVVNGGLLSPLTEDNWPASPEKTEMILPEELPTPSCAEQQQMDLCSTASTEAQSVDRETSPPT